MSSMASTAAEVETAQRQPEDVEKAQSSISSVSSITVVKEGDEAAASPPAATAPLDWDGPNDPDNPWNWSMGKRWFGTIIPGCLCLLV
jgi:hypothetical protein